MPGAAIMISGFWAELKRRKVVRVAVGYMIAAAGIMGAADAFGDALHLPSWALTAVALTLAAGLPVVLLLAWLFDITRDVAEPAVVDLTRPAAAAPRRHTIPAPAAPLVGRETELAEAIELLGRPDCRLLTLTGTAGIGKTRLAQEVATHVGASCLHGTCFVALADVELVDAVPAAIADALGLPLAARENPQRQLAGFLQEKQLLLVLDNYEHLVAGASLVNELLAIAPGLRVLVTSQRRLRIAGETVLSVDALSVPVPGVPLEHSAAAVLFLQIAQRNDPRFRPDAADVDAIARICRVMGGVPLAIELAAASVGLLSCPAIAASLEQHHDSLLSARRDLPPRHQSLSAAFESSWRLLDRDEQQAFRRLSALHGSFDEAAAFAVAGAPLRMLGRLAEASLVKRRAAARYEVLPVLREFAEERLRQDPAELADVLLRHERHFLGRVAALSALEAEPAREAALDEVAESSADVRAAWLRAAARGDHHDLRRAAGGLFLLLEARGRSGEGAELFQRAVAAVEPLAAAEGEPRGVASAALARLLPRQAAFSADLGRVSEAAELLARALPLLRAEHDRAELAFALSKQCNILRAAGEYRAHEFEEALALYREEGDRRGVASALNSLGTARHAVGDYEKAKRLYGESIALFRNIGLATEAWPAINNLAGIALVEGDLAEARRILENELDTFRRRDNPRALSFLLNNLGLIAYRAGDHQAAVPVLEESVALAREMGYRTRLGYSLNVLGNIRMDHHDLATAAATYREALAVAVAAEEGPLVPEILIGLARVQLQQGDRDGAAVILRAVQQHPATDEETRTGAAALLRTLGPTHGEPVTGAALDDIVEQMLSTSEPAQLSL